MSSFRGHSCKREKISIDFIQEKKAEKVELWGKDNNARVVTLANQHRTVIA